MSSRRFAVLKTGNGSEFVQKTYGGFDKMSEKLLADDGEEWVVYSVMDGDFSFENEIDTFAGFVITGSPADAHADDDWVLKLCEVLKVLNQKKKKVLGICFGHQVLARALGGKTGRSDVGWELGLKQVHLDTELVSKAFNVQLPPTVNVLVSHRDQVSCVPPGALILGSSKKTKIEMFSIGDHVLGLQYHPEFFKDVVLDIIHNLLTTNMLDDDTAKEAIQSVEENDLHQEQLKGLCKTFLKGPAIKEV
ncbi:Gamma-glutamyl peptidase 5 [Nymphaea thermarum]|nr:Gamma-glutamyl peptidase 5 [Nymphaea thermarum]